jgi:YVTN family beta-propeller protein
MAKALILISLLAAGAYAQQTAVVVQKRDNSVGFYDALTGAARGTAPVGTKPHEMALSPDRRLAYVTNYGVDSYTETAEGGRSLSIVDLVRRQTIGEIDLGRFRRPHGIERGRSGLLYVTVDSPPSLLVIDPIKRAVVRSIDVGQALPHMVAVTHDERKAYTANAGAGTLTVIALGQGKAVKHIEIGGVPMGLALARDGRRLLAANRTGNAVVVIDTAKDEVVSQIDIPGQPARVAFTPDGKHLIVTLIEAGDVAIVETATLRVINRFRAGASAEGVGVDPQGRFSYVSAQGDNKVIKYSTRDWRPVLEIKTGARPDPIEIIETRR